MIVKQPEMSIAQVAAAAATTTTTTTTVVDTIPATPATTRITRAASRRAVKPAAQETEPSSQDPAPPAPTPAPVLSIDAPCFSTPAPPTTRRGRPLRSALKERNAPPSVPRYPRPGETVLSQNGSPLGVYGGANAKVDTDNSELAKITVRLESGALV